MNGSSGLQDENAKPAIAYEYVRRAAIIMYTEAGWPVLGYTAIERKSAVFERNDEKLGG